MIMFQRINLKKVIEVLLILMVLTLSLEILTNSSSTSDEEVSKIDNQEKEIVTIQENTLNDLRNKYKNNDIIGIIKIVNTSINEPVVQTHDNDYYLTHTLKKEYDKYGSIYMDYRIDLNHSKKILIFGHNSEAYNKDKVPFKELENYYEEDYYKQHKYITLTLDNEIRHYEIFSVYVETSDFTYMNLYFKDEEDWYRHISKLKSKSLYNTNVEISSDDEILILQTCSNNKDYSSYDKKYLLIISRRVKE